MADEPKKLSEIKEGEAAPNAATEAEAEKVATEKLTETDGAEPGSVETEATDKTETSEDAPAENKPEKKKKFGLPFFKGKGKKSQEKETEIELPKEPLTPEELVNTIDGEIKIHAETKQARLAAVMNNQIESPKSNHITVKFKVRQLLLLSGIVVITTWLVVLISLVYDFAREQGVDFGSIFNRSEPNSETDGLSPEESRNQVRIRDASQGSTQVTELANNLETNFEIPYVEIVEDTEFEDQTITLYARSDAYQLLLELIEGLGETYAVASGSAQLSDDSDFGIVITFPALSSGETGTTEEATNPTE